MLLDDHHILWIESVLTMCRSSIDDCCWNGAFANGYSLVWSGLTDIALVVLSRKSKMAVKFISVMIFGEESFLSRQNLPPIQWLAIGRLWLVIIIKSILRSFFWSLDFGGTLKIQRCVFGWLDWIVDLLWEVDWIVTCLLEMSRKFGIEKEVCFRFLSYIVGL